MAEPLHQWAPELVSLRHLDVVAAALLLLPLLLLRLLLLLLRSTVMALDERAGRM